MKSALFSKTAWRGIGEVCWLAGSWAGFAWGYSMALKRLLKKVVGVEVTLTNTVEWERGLGTAHRIEGRGEKPSPPWERWWPGDGDARGLTTTGDSDKKGRKTCCKYLPFPFWSPYNVRSLGVGLHACFPFEGIVAQS